MKKFLIIALAFIMICAVSACSFADSNSDNSSQEWDGWTDFY